MKTICLLKQKSIAKLTEIIETFNLCHIWKSRSPKTKSFNFIQEHCLGFLERHLDYIFISNAWLETILNTKLLLAFVSDHSPVLKSYNKMRNISVGPGFLKFNNTLLNKETFKVNLRDIFFKSKSRLNYNDTQLNWE